MKRVQGQSTENTFKVCGFEVLSNEELNVVRGGTDDGPRTKDRDVFDLGED